MKKRYSSLRGTANALKFIAAFVVVFGTLGAFLLARPIGIRYSFDIASFIAIELSVLITALLLSAAADVFRLLIDIEENTRATAIMTKRLQDRQQTVKRLPDEDSWPLDV